MKRLLLIAALTVGSPAFGDAQADTRFLVDMHLGPGGGLERLEELSNQAIETIIPAITDLGGTVPDQAALKDALLGDTEEQLIALMRAHWTAEFAAKFRESEIAALATFYRSDEYRKTYANFVQNGALPHELDAFLEDDFAPMIEHWSDLQDSMPELEERIKAALQDVYGLDRFAEVFAMKDIVSFESEAHRKEVIDAIHAYLDQ